MSISLLTGFDGASPRDDVGVRQVAEGRFVVYPNYRRVEGISEECIAGAGARLSVRIRNDGPSAAPVTVVADWQTESCLEYRDLGFVRLPDEDWRQIPGQRDKTTICYNLLVPPGVTALALYPEYNVEQCRRFVEHLGERGARLAVPGHSAEGRDIWLVHVPASRSGCPSLMVQARDHAYESAGSYCIEGIIDFLLSDCPSAQCLRERFEVYCLPMANPDGVHNGMSRLTAERGANLNRLVTECDLAHDAVRAAIDHVRPQVYLNIHNWQVKDVDGLLVNASAVGPAILQHIAADTEHGKRWLVESAEDWLKANGLTALREQDKSWKNYVEERFGGVGVTVEFPWPGLTPADMRAKGALFLQAYAQAAIDLGVV